MSQTTASDSEAGFSEQERRELAASLDKTPSALPLERDDLFTRAMVRYVLGRVGSWTPNGPSAVGLPKSHGPLEKIDVIPAIVRSPAFDEDGEQELLPKQMLSRKLKAMPVLDFATPWPTPGNGAKVNAAEFGPLLPPPPVQWPEVTTDRAMSLVAFQGLGAHRLEPLDNDPEGAAWAVDLSWMCAFPVREGLVHYGACAYFGADRTLLRIHTAPDDRTHRPGDTTWADAKWRWRCSLFTAVTVADHLGGTHYLSSNALVTMTRERLPEDHPMRRLLKPFGFGAVDINVGAVYTLSPPGGMAHRVFGFTYEGLVRCLLRGIETTHFQTFPDTMAAKRVAALGDAYPYATDGLDLYAILRTYADEYLDVFYPGERIVEDPAIRAWWRGFLEFAPTLGLGPLNRRQQLIDLVTQLMFIVTGFHGHIGTLAPYILDPSFMGPKIRAGSQVSDIQSSTQLLNLTVLTQLAQPAMIGDYTHLFLDREKARTTAIFQRYQAALTRLSREIEARNKRRTQPYETFNPVHLKVSVST